MRVVLSGEDHPHPVPLPLREKEKAIFTAKFVKKGKSKMGLDDLWFFFSFGFLRALRVSVVKKGFCFGLLLLSILPGPLFAWGVVGHETIGYIAQDRLSPAAKAAVRDLLGPDEDLASVSTWADSIVKIRPETAPWHYFNLDVRQVQNKYDIADVCRNHDCVVDQIRKDLGILGEKFASKKEKREALKFLVHFVGDLHQPLHCADDHDRGGNDKWFRYYGPRGTWRHFTWVNFHGFWDDLLETRISEGSERLSRRLEESILPADAQVWEQGNVTDWAFESFLIAKNDIYKELPRGPVPEKNRWGKDLPEDYYSGEMRSIVDRQLEKAGVRLAFLLNGIFKH